MKKTINLNEEKSMTFKSSAATNILFKRAFHEDILVKLAAYTKNLKELRKMQSQIAELKNDESKTQEQILETINDLTSSEAFTSSTTFMNETLPKLAYVMFVEANESQETIFNKLNEESYLAWLLTIDQDELLAITGQIMEVWQMGAKNTSKPKN